ncbi:hypothetical protein [Nocardia macrotermitis]|uniref:Uncharacterized protein n=1 Tax=Nocardia macrotermitis TaxID=2585198 RepID=A0A7K0CWF5_9NOCA|nr:hypothetical protein [Nocardia macrotermitis]MQY17741.1 hypothetical protein [Nocardia macrotermitis]
MAYISFVSDSVRRLRARYILTREERRNLHLANSPLAVISASIGSPVR